MNITSRRPCQRLVGLAALILVLTTGCSDPAVPETCAAFEFNGQVYDCTVLDRCTEEDFQYRLACCECDVELCNPDPSCPPQPPCLAVTDTDTKAGAAAQGGQASSATAGDVQKCSPPWPSASCFDCHSGISHPHPFQGEGMECVTCHGGDPRGEGMHDSHVPPPPAIGDRAFQQSDALAFFQRTTLTGIDALEPYTVNDQSYTGLDYVQFVNPGDLRVVSAGRGCGSSGCHGDQHGAWMSKSPMTTAAGILGVALHRAGLPNENPEYRGWYVDTAADFGFRAVADPDFAYTGDDIGRVGALAELPEHAHHGAAGGMFENPLYSAANLADDVVATSTAGGPFANQIIPGSPLHALYQSSLAMACGGCHLGSAGQNNRFGSYRSSGCTACHMAYSFDGRSVSRDDSIAKNEPGDVDALAPGERSHPMAHQMRSSARILDQGAFLRGIDDKACAGCHVGSNATWLQYRGIRPDTSQAVTRGVQYPANPVSFQNAAPDYILFNPALLNQTFAGMSADQLVAMEDYDGDGRDDTPSDIHHERGMACIDCHGGRDLHNGATGDASSGALWSRQDQAVAITCESCHGTISAYAATVACIDLQGLSAECAADSRGNALQNVTVDGNGGYWLRGRVDGLMHYVTQTRDTVVQTSKNHPVTGQGLYTARASYAMGRVDGDGQTGLGPQQGDTGLVSPGFAHSDTMDCVSCHAAWTNTCVGCHLGTAYDDSGDFFSNITGQRIVLTTASAAPVYATPVPMFLGVGPRNRITQTAPGIGLFVRYIDLEGERSRVFAFTDRHGNGNNPGHAGRGALGALGHGQITPHSIRGRVDASNEGPRYCVSCHLDQAQMATYGAEYAQFYADMQSGALAGLDHARLAQHIGQNPGNQLGSPYWVHMAAGLGSGLFLFDASGCPVNPIDSRVDHPFCDGVAPASRFDASRAVYQLDRVVEPSGVANASSGHPLLHGAPATQPAGLRDGALQPDLAGPLGGSRVQKLASPTTGLILDGWLDASGHSQGTATGLVP